ncbi:cytochrome c biosynthesis protein [Planctomycetales bacterium]|nr:cytochrome c biosynthesis protein [Planctomycetales bacterium]
MLSLVDTMKYRVPFALFLCFAGCSVTVPEQFTDAQRLPAIYPDYTDTTIPPNIAPMNFAVNETGDAFITKITSETGTSIVVSGQTAQIPIKKWKTLLTSNRGKDLNIDIYVRTQQSWKKFKTIRNRIAEEPIDPYISYRLIEPGYDDYYEMTINERSVDTFNERMLLQNRLVGQGQCINCHTCQNRRTEKMLFHSREFMSGTVFVQNGRTTKVKLSTQELLAGGSYPSYHPDSNFVAFSCNDTRQQFYVSQIRHDNNTFNPKVEVFDAESDLVLYDVNKNEILPVLATTDDFETFPVWSQDGNWLYYACAKPNLSTLPSAYANPYNPNVTEKERNERRQSRGKWVMANITLFHYNLMRMPFDRQTRKFGKPELVFDAASQGKSAVFPRSSPSGRYIMFTASDYGTFPIWHKEADLWILDTATGQSRCMDEVNSQDTESFHNWSENGKWFVFSSRRDDGSYTRLYFAHFDEETGMASKPFLLPQREPASNFALFKSYNLPDFLVEPVRVSPLTYWNAALKSPQNVDFIKD